MASLPAPLPTGSLPHVFHDYVFEDLYKVTDGTHVLLVLRTPTSPSSNHDSDV